MKGTTVMAAIYVRGAVTMVIWAAVACALIYSKAFSATEIFSCYLAAIIAGAAAYSTKQIWNPDTAVALKKEKEADALLGNKPAQ